MNNMQANRDEMSAQLGDYFDKRRRNQKLSTADRMEIGYRRMEGESPMALASEYKVSRGTIDNCPKLERP